jgi:hypothetical protein
VTNVGAGGKADAYAALKELATAIRPWGETTEPQALRGLGVICTKWRFGGARAIGDALASSQAPQYQVQPASSRPPLDAEDEALLRSEGGGKMGKGQVTRTFANKVQGDFTWLLRTQYISEDQVSAGVVRGQPLLPPPSPRLKDQSRSHGRRASKTDVTIRFWPHDASSAAWSSTPSLQRSYQLCQTTGSLTHVPVTANRNYQVPKHLGVSEKKVKEMRNAETANAPLSYEDERAAQLAAIEASFEAATRPPVHATKPHLTPVEVLPVFPDEERWLSPLVQVLRPVSLALVLWPLRFTNLSALARAPCPLTPLRRTPSRPQVALRAP